MFDFSIGEMAVIATVALVVIGPKRLPEVAKMVGKGLGSLKKTFDEVKEGVHTELTEIKETSGIKEALNGGAELKKSLQDMTEQVKTDFRDAMNVSVTEPPADAAHRDIVEEKK